MFSQHFSIASIPIHLRSAIAWHPRTLHFDRICRRYGTKADPATPPAWTVTVVGAVKPPKEMPPLQNREGVYYAEHKLDLFLAAPSAQVLVHGASRCIELALHEPDISLHDRIVQEYLKLAISMTVLERGGLPCHASAVLTPSLDALVFTGPSGTGKTTIARHLEDPGVILNDEYVVLLPSESGYVVHATPFTSPEKLLFCQCGQAPVRRFYLLKQSDHIESAEPSFRELYFGLLQSVYSFPTTAASAEQIFANVERAARSLPVQHLYFPNDRAMLQNWAFPAIALQADEDR